MIDFHTHIFPDKLAGRAIEKLQKSSSSKACLGGTAKELKGSMKKAGIKKSVILPIAVRPNQSHTINLAAADNNKDDAFVSFGSVHPYDDNWQQELQNIKKYGLPGIKLHPDFQQIDLNDEKMVQVMQCAARLGLCVTIHAGMDVSYPNLHRSTPQMLAEILPELKGSKIICAHTGGYMYTKSFTELLLGKEEIYIDTSFSIGHMKTAELTYIYKHMPKGRVLFGTDSPWDDQKRAVNDVRALKLGEKLENEIFLSNAESLLKGCTTD